jgi:hypothetical protein
MVKFIFLSISMMRFNDMPVADTISYWHIYYNTKKIKECNTYSKEEIRIKEKDVKRTDFLMIEYFRDTPCSECKTQVIIESNKQFIITKGTGIGTFNPVKIAVFDLLQYHLKNKKEIYKVLYYEEQLTNKVQKVLLFRIKLE